MASTIETEKEPFSIKDCALVAIATGKKARQLVEFRDLLANVEAASIYHHFWGDLLEPRFDIREYNNDFANWVRHGIHDKMLAEQLAALDPTDYADMEQLRQSMIELIETRLEDAEQLTWTRATEQFEFIRSQIVVFDTQKRLSHPNEFIDVVPTLSTSSVFYHFIDARRRTENGIDDFSEWIGAYDEEFVPLREQLAGVDPFFGTLSELRERIAQVFNTFFAEKSK